MALKKAKCDAHRSTVLSQGYKETDKKAKHDVAVSAGGTSGGSVVCEKSGGGTITYYFYKESSTPATDKWKCNGSGPCVKDSSGTYNSKAECEAATACDSSVTPPPPPTPSTTYSVCPGPTYSNGCKDSGAPNPNGIIYKVQGCIGATQDSKFGPKTEKALKLKTGKTTFSDDDVSTICKGSSSQDGQSGQSGQGMTEEKQLEFFVSLSGTGRVYDGYVHKFDKSDTLLKDGSILKYCYVKKFECTRNEQGKIVAIGEGVPISGKSDVTYSPNHIFILLFPDLSYVYMDKRNSMVTNPSFTWRPGNAVFSESRKRKRLSEQNIDFSPILGSSWNFDSTGSGNQSQSSGNQSQSSGNQSQSSGNQIPGKKYEVNYEKLCSYVNPKRDEAVQILEGMRDMKIPILNIPLVNEDGKKQLQQSIDDLKKVDCKTVCDSGNLKILADGKAMILDKQKNDPNAKYVKGKLERLLVLIEEIENECKRIEKERRNFESQGSGTGSGSQGSGSQGVTTVVTGSRKDELRKLFGFVDEDGNTMSPKTTISKMNKNPERGYVSGMGSLQYAINNYEARSEWFEDFNELMDAEGLSEFKLKFPDNFEDEEYAGEEIDKENYSALTPIKSDAKSQYKKFTFGNFFGNESRLPIFQVQSGSGEFGVKKTKCSGNPRQKLIDYLNAALSGSMSFRGSNELDYFERCLATNKLQPQFEEEGPLRRSDFTEVDPDNLPFNAFNNKLGLKEIIRLLRGEEVNGAEITNNNLIDKDFYNKKFAVYESVRKTVKKNLSEAITKKKNLKITESALTKILTNIKRKGY